MHKIKIIAVGKIKERPLTELFGEYIKRLGRYCSLDIIEVLDESVSAHENAADIQKHLRAEADRLLERLRSVARIGAYKIALDIKGHSLDSINFASKLNYLVDHFQEIIFIIGGSHGLHNNVLSYADYTFSMSELTFPHQLARLILVEQIYRAYKIIGNETYHK